MKVIIIEDEVLAQSKLETMLQAIDRDIEVVAKLGSARESIAYLTQHAAPDVAFVDIQLSDDHCFQIFRTVPVQFPVIFTTAYDKYLLESFEHNAIDYLLKPVTHEKLARSIAKLKNLEMHFLQGNLHRLVHETSPPRGRLIVKKGTEFMTLTASDVAYIFTEHKVVFLKDKQGRQYILDKNLTELEHELDQKYFFRLNRKFIAHMGAIEKFKSDNGKIRIFLKPPLREEVFISKESAPEFRKWFAAE